MAMGKRKRDRQAAIWVPTTDLPTAASHPFYRRLSQLLREHGFDDFAEGQCAGFYAETMGRPGLPQGIYFRLLLIGYFEGIDAERGIAWRAADSLALRDFLGIGLDQAPPDHSTISRTRRLIALETHRAVFTWILQCLGTAGLVKRKTIGIDATTLEANAALRSIVRRDSGESYEEFLTKLAKASGIGTPTRADLARIDRKRKKKGSNNDWTHPHDPDAKITRMKDGRTHLSHKAEHAIDLDTGAIVGVTVQGADEGDTTTIQETLPEAAEQLEAVAAVADSVAVIEEVVADKGYHSRRTVHDLETLEIRTYISEPDRGSQSWTGQHAERDAVYANRRRIRGDRGQRLLRKRGELLERPCAHLYETGGLRRTHVRGHENVLKRLLVHAGAFNLGLWMRTLLGVCTPRSLQGRLTTLGAVLNTLWTFTSDAMTTLWTSPSDSTGSSARDARIRWHGVARVRNATCTTGSLKGPDSID
jgi:transposase